MKWRHGERLAERWAGAGGRGGQALVELALALPVLLLLLLGVVEGGAMIRDNMTVGNAAREGARAAAVGRPTGAITNRTSQVASPMEVSGANGAVVLEWSTNNGTTWYQWPANVTNPDTGVQSNGVPAGGMVRIQVTSRHDAMTGLIPFMTRNLTRTAVLRREPN